MSDSTAASPKIDRRSFLNQTAAAMAGAGVFSSSALSYSRIKGANERIRTTDLDAHENGASPAQRLIVPATRPRGHNRCELALHGARGSARAGSGGNGRRPRSLARWA